MGSPDDKEDVYDVHYHQTIENFALIASENLHFLGYFETPGDSLNTALGNLNRLFAEKTRASATDHLLDVGCGTGGPACYMAQTLGCRVTGIDRGEEQIARAREAAEEKGLTRQVTFYRQDATKTTFEDGRFDVILMMGSASHTPVKEDLFAECARIVKAGGRLVFGDAVLIDMDWCHDKRNATKAKVIDIFFGDPILETLQGYEDLIKSSGFTNLEVHPLTSHAIRSFKLWDATLEEKRDAFIDQLGKARFRGLSKSVRIIGDTVRDGFFDAAIISAEK